MQYHQEELALSEASIDRLGTAIAHRKVGECLCELGDYERAVHHQMKHLEIAQETGMLQTTSPPCIRLHAVYRCDTCGWGYLSSLS